MPSVAGRGSQGSSESSWLSFWSRVSMPSVAGRGSQVTLRHQGDVRAGAAVSMPSVAGRGSQVTGAFVLCGTPTRFNALCSGQGVARVYSDRYVPYHAAFQCPL